MSLKKSDTNKLNEVACRNFNQGDSIEKEGKFKDLNVYYVMNVTKKAIQMGVTVLFFAQYGWLFW